TLAITRYLAVRRLARSLDELDIAEGGDDIDIVHVFGGSAWQLAAELAAEMDAGLVIEVWRAGLVERARSLSAAQERPPMLIAPDPAIERSLPSGGPLNATVRLAQWGVLAPPERRTVLPGDRAPTAMIVGSGRDERAFAAALEGIAGVVRDRRDLLV